MYPALFLIPDSKGIFQGRDGTDFKIEGVVWRWCGQASTMKSVLYPQFGDNKRREDRALPEADER